jgi:hypothetical protein
MSIYVAIYGKERWEARSLADLQEKWLQHVRDVDMTMHTMRGNPRVSRDGQPIGWMSYNGVTWPCRTRDWKPGTVALTA